MLAPLTRAEFVIYMMNRRRRAVLVLMAAIVIASFGSHLVVSYLRMGGPAATPFVIGKSFGKPPAFLAASSIGSYGIAWDQIADDIGTEIRGWGVAGGTPIEFEQLQKKVPEARTTFIVVSTCDLDEATSCEWRSSIVPLSQAFASLEAEHADWQEMKTVLGQYLVKWLGVVFPTVGRSHVVFGMTAMRVTELIHYSSGKIEGPVLKFGKAPANDVYVAQKLSDWPRSKIITKLASRAVEFHAPHSFDGAKKQALGRMLEYANQLGPTVVLVMPISASYTHEYFPPKVSPQFEATLAQLQHSAPKTEFLRLDQVPGLTSDDNFCDVVHMNLPGQKLATQALRAWVKNSGLARQP